MIPKVENELQEMTEQTSQDISYAPTKKPTFVVPREISTNTLIQEDTLPIRRCANLNKFLI